MTNIPLQYAEQMRIASAINDRNEDDPEVKNKIKLVSIRNFVGLAHSFKLV